MRYLSIIACVMLLVLGLLGCKAQNTPHDETPGQVPPHDPDHTGRPNIYKVIVTDVEEGTPSGSGRSSMPAPAPAAEPAPEPTPEPTPEPAAEPAAEPTVEPADDPEAAVDTDSSTEP